MRDQGAGDCYRGKAGGIKVAKDVEEARAHADAIIGMDICGPRGEGPFRVHEVWVEEASDIDAEYYASIILDRPRRRRSRSSRGWAG